MTVRYRVGIVGCGRKASTIDDEGKCPVNYCRPPCAHAAAYALLPNVELAAACATGQASRRAFGARGVLCEKALATSLEEADAMLAACARHGTRLLVDHPRRFHPTYALARAAVQAGEIGQLRAIVATAGGAVVHNGTHLFDLVRY